MRSLDDLTQQDLTDGLTYAGLVLIAFELVKRMIVGPIKTFYAGVTFGPGLPFTTYEQDVGKFPGDEFEKCLLYLRHHMKAIDDNDRDTILRLRRHRNDLAHDLVSQLPQLRFEHQLELFLAVERTLFKLSNYRLRMEIGADPEFALVDWATAKGSEYMLFAHVISQVKLLGIPARDA